MNKKNPYDYLSDEIRGIKKALDTSRKQSRITNLLSLVSVFVVLFVAFYTVSENRKIPIENINYENTQIAVKEILSITQTHLSIPTPALPTPSSTPQINMIIIDNDMDENKYIFRDEAVDFGKSINGFSGKEFEWTITTREANDINLFYWCPVFSQSGNYQIDVFIINKEISLEKEIKDRGLSNKANYQLVRIEKTDGGEKVCEFKKNEIVDQDENAEGKWVTLKKLSGYFQKGNNNICLMLGDKTSDTANKVLVFDAVRWVYQKP